MTLGLYLHLPFCRARCSYCAFAISTDRGRQADYQEAFLREIGSSPFAGSPVDSIYFGGGTPSLTPFEDLQAVMRLLRARFRVDSAAELTIEANPEDVTGDLAGSWCRELGVNRISLGVQSFNDAELFPLGRGHATETARRAIGLALGTGARVSLDLILGLPNQTSQSFGNSLATALSYGAGHLSLYMLDLEEGSPLEKQVHSKKMVLPEEELVAESYLAAIATAERAGLHQYEISNFARRGEESRHNLRYWNRQAYLGFGLGAHSFDGEHRWANTRDLAAYLELALAGQSPVTFRETLAETERTRELLFLGLRQARGLRYSELLDMRGEEASAWVSRGLNEGWLQSDSDRIAFTGSGFLLSNNYISQLF